MKTNPNSPVKRLCTGDVIYPRLFWAEVELDECPELRGFLHLVYGHLSGQVEGTRGDHVMHDEPKPRPV
jgi:hypothetical protein